jgi:cell division protein FtsB
MGRVRRLSLPASLGLALYWAIFGGEYSYFELRGARQEKTEVEAQLARLRWENDSLRAWADSLQNDSATIERFARERLGLIRDGEILYRSAEAPDTVGDTLP